jgi:hypothetical protein
MFRDPVVSRSIASVGFYDDTETLEVEFVTGRIYRYFGVSDDVHQQFLAAPSKGTFFNEHIRDDYPCVRVK